MTHHTMSKRSYHGAIFGDKDWDVGRNEKIGTAARLERNKIEFKGKREKNSSWITAVKKQPKNKKNTKKPPTKQNRS